MRSFEPDGRARVVQLASLTLFGLLLGLASGEAPAAASAPIAVPSAVPARTAASAPVSPAATAPTPAAAPEPKSTSASAPVPPTGPAAAPGGAPGAALTPAPPPPLPPGTPLYEVEIVVFQAVGLPAGEDWAAVPTPRGFGTPGTASGLDPQVVRILTPTDYHLMGVVDGLRRNGAWRPVAHAAWIQNAPNWGSHVGIPTSAVGIDVPQLTGLIFLERAPLYLHLGFDVRLQDGATYAIDEMHNIRQNEKEYFDHPRLRHHRRGHGRQAAPTLNSRRGRGVAPALSAITTTLSPVAYWY